MGNAVIYTRVSTWAQEDGYSLGAQEKDGRAYCERRGHTVVAVESDTFTGHDSLEERDGMQSAIRLIRRGDADTLVIWKVDRAGRFMIDNLLLHQDVSQAGGYLESVVEGPIPNTPEGKFMLSVYSFVGERERLDIIARTQRGLTDRIGQGYILPSAVPLFGYQWKGERKEWYDIDPESGPIVKDMYNKAAMGWAIRRIVKYLSANNFPTPSKLLWLRGELPEARRMTETWHRNTVRDILTCESYTGKHSARRWENYKATVRKADGTVKTIIRKRERLETDQTRVYLDIPAMVSREQWEAVQQRIKSRQLDNTGDENEVLLNKGFAYCGVCGARMIAVKHRGKRHYQCTYRTGLSVGSRNCPGKAFAIRAEEVDPDVWDKVKEILRDEPRFQRIVKGKSAQLDGQHADAVRHLQMVEKELSDTREQSSRMFERMNRETDECIHAMYREELKKLNVTVAALEKSVREAKTAVNGTQNRRTKYQEAVAMAMQYAAGYKTDSAAQADMQEALHGPGTDPAKRVQLVENLPRIMDETTLDMFSREQKRSFLRMLGVQVTMYPVNSEHARNNATRWEVTSKDSVLLSPIPGSGDVL